MVIAVWTVVILVIGILIWVLASNAILKEIGRWMFIIGLFWLVSTLATKTVKIGAGKARTPHVASLSGPDQQARATSW